MIIIFVICLPQIITSFYSFKITLFFQKFATEGLRTLLLGIRDLTEQEFNNWKTAHHNAAIALENREAKLDEVYDTIERDLDILGATAIEDKLQV